MPVGAYGGRADIIAKSPSGPVYQAGSLSGNPLAMASGLATLEVLCTESPYPRFEHLSDRLEKGLKTASSDAGSVDSSTTWKHDHHLLSIRGKGGELQRCVPIGHEQICPFFWKLMAPRDLLALQSVRSSLRFRDPHGRTD